MIQQFFKLEWLNLRRSTALIGGLVLILLCGMYAVFYGKTQLDKHHTIVAKMQTAYEENEAKIAEKSTPNRYAAEHYRQPHQCDCSAHADGLGLPCLWVCVMCNRIPILSAIGN
ncbi:MAG: hypothetical protein HC817_08555 [Saprospiraceae bacterium]|nr:hypothetical protein [Saprospiraceae bacterium]